MGRSPGEENDNPLQYSCLENPTDRGAWWATVSGVARVGHDLAAKPPPSFRGSLGLQLTGYPYWTLTDATLGLDPATDWCVPGPQGRPSTAAPVSCPPQPWTHFSWQRPGPRTWSHNQKKHQGFGEKVECVEGMYTLVTRQQVDYSRKLHCLKTVGFPGGPVAETSPSNAGDAGFISGQGAKTPPAAQHGQKIINKYYKNATSGQLLHSRK